MLFVGQIFSCTASFLVSALYMFHICWHENIREIKLLKLSSAIFCRSGFSCVRFPDVRVHLGATPQRWVDLSWWPCSTQEMVQNPIDFQTCFADMDQRTKALICIYAILLKLRKADTEAKRTVGQGLEDGASESNQDFIRFHLDSLSSACVRQTFAERKSSCLRPGITGTGQRKVRVLTRMEHLVNLPRLLVVQRPAPT